VARGAISAIPVFGGPAAELLGLVLQPAFDRRREEWLAQLGSALDDLQSRVDNFPEELSANEVFITTVMAATTAAFRTHEAEKVEALRNAIVSSGTSNLDDYEQLTFVRYVDELTAFHLRLMVYLRDPKGWLDHRGIDRPQFMAAGRSSALEIAMPELSGRKEVYEQAVGDLVARHLVGSGLSGMVSGSAVYDPLTTPFGNRFLDHISRHEGDEPQ